MSQNKYFDEWSSKLTVGQRLRFARTRQDISQKELSRRCGMHVNCISVYELDKVEPSFFAITHLANALGVSLDWLAGRRANQWRDMN